MRRFGHIIVGLALGMTIAIVVAVLLVLAVRLKAEPTVGIVPTVEASNRLLTNASTTPTVTLTASAHSTIFVVIHSSGSLQRGLDANGQCEMGMGDRNCGV